MLEPPGRGGGDIGSKVGREFFGPEKMFAIVAHKLSIAEFQHVGSGDKGGKFGWCCRQGHWGEAFMSNLVRLSTTLLPWMPLWDWILRIYNKR